MSIASLAVATFAYFVVAICFRAQLTLDPFHLREEVLAFFALFKRDNVRTVVVGSTSILQSVNLEPRQVFDDPFAQFIVAKVPLIASIGQKPSIRDREMFGAAIVCLLFEGIPPMLKLFRSVEHYRFIYYHWIIIIFIISPVSAGREVD